MSKIIQLKQENRKGKIELKNKAETGEQQLFFYGDIVSDKWSKWSEEDTCPSDVTDLLKNIDESKDLNIYINSGGGSVFAGVAIYNQLKRKQCNKIVHIDGIAASIASIIALAGDKIIIPSTAQLMIHKPWGGCRGNAIDMRNYADFLDKNEEIIMGIYESHLKEGVKTETIKEMVENETWLTGEEASNYFNIEVEEGYEAAACISSFFDSYRNLPKDIKNEKVNQISAVNAEEQALIDRVNKRLEIINLGGM